MDFRIFAPPELNTTKTKQGIHPGLRSAGRFVRPQVRTVELSIFAATAVTAGGSCPAAAKAAEAPTAVAVTAKVEQKSPRCTGYHFQ